MLLGYDEIMIYTQADTAGIIRPICDAIGAAKRGEHIEQHRREVCEAISRLIDYCDRRGLTGDLWADYITDIMVNDVNAFSLMHERTHDVSGSLTDIAAHDIYVFYYMLRAEVKDMLDQLGFGYAGVICDYQGGERGYLYDPQVRDLICSLAAKCHSSMSSEAMRESLMDFYGTWGVGDIGLHRAFSIECGDETGVRLVPVTDMDEVHLDDLIGYESAKSKLVQNTEAHIAGLPANNCLLYGDAGTGKSTCVRALAFEYFSQGLRIIQVKRDQFKYLDALIALIKNRNYRFIIYMDDLSFEEFETDYKYLKALIEGGLEGKPSNILIYATSNRRHLIRETVSDRDDRDEDMHRSDTMSEKLSLSQRFGVSIYFGRPAKKEYNTIVLGLAKRLGLQMPEDELLAEANKWELSHGGLSGRTARQLIDHLLGLKSGGIT